MDNKIRIFDVAVVGAGVMGSSTAYYLTKNKNLSVVVFEQFDFLHRQGSSHGESRIIRMTYPQPHYTELMSPAYKMWNELEICAETKVLTPTGGLDFGKRSNPELQSLIKIAEKYNVRHEILSPAELTRRFPTLRIPHDWVAVYSPSSGVLNASKAVGVFQNLARKQGAVMLDNMKISKVEKGAYCTELITPDGKVFRARKVIFTTGPWTKKILADNLGIDLPLVPVQTTAAYWKVDKPEAYSSKIFPVFINYEEPLIYGTPAQEFPGLIKCAAHGGKPIDPDSRDFLPGKEVLGSEVGPFLQAVFEGVSKTPVMTESCMYTWSPDYDFIIDQLPVNEALYVGCGFSGHGFKLAPIVGFILSELVVNGRHPFPNVHPIFSIANINKRTKGSKL